MRLLLFVLLLAVCAPAVQAGEVPVWTLHRSKSSIVIKGFAHGEPFSVAFQSFNAEIAFDPEQPDKSSAVVTIDTRSGSKGDKTYTDYLVAPPWFKPEQVPLAQFHITSFTPMDKDTFQANGTFYLYNAAKTVQMPFPGIGIPVKTKFRKMKKKPMQAEFTSNFTFAVPDYAKPEPGKTRRAIRKLNLVMTLKAEKAPAGTPSQKPSGK